MSKCSRSNVGFTPINLKINPLFHNTHMPYFCLFANCQYT